MALNIIMSASYGVFDVIIWSLVAACFVRLRRFGLRAWAASSGRSPSCCASSASASAFWSRWFLASRAALIVGVSIGALYVLVMLGLFNVLRRKRHCDRPSPSSLEEGSRHPESLRRCRPTTLRHAQDSAPSRGTGCRRRRERGRPGRERRAGAVRRVRGGLRAHPARGRGAFLSGARTLRQGDRRRPVRVRKHRAHAHPPHSGKDRPAFEAAGHRLDRALPVKGAEAGGLAGRGSAHDWRRLGGPARHLLFGHVARLVKADGVADERGGRPWIQRLEEVLRACRDLAQVAEQESARRIRDSRWARRWPPSPRPRAA